ncbi:MAG: hypothetical protein U0L45_01045 [Alistipes sp.]|jgi:hypothetical protein|nr:hypothetical protein [Alistipes sp.]
MTHILKTKKRIAREVKYQAMYADYCNLVADPDNDKMAIIGYLTKKHKISQSCIYNYLRTKKNA